MTRVGVIGASPGNGHPFSFSAIINGYSPGVMIEEGWAVIEEYLRRREPEEFGYPGVTVTHAWTQDPATTEALRRACFIEKSVEAPSDMVGVVDAVLIARDDYETHASLAMPLLEAGLPVFVDKPLTLRRDELDAFRPHLEGGQLMSCSGLRFAVELDPLRSSDGLGELVAVRGTVINSWETYGIHLIDAILGATDLRPTSVRRIPAKHDALVVETVQGAVIAIDALGKLPKVFNLIFFGRDRIFASDLMDNFGAFRRLLDAFFRMVETGKPPVDPEQTVLSIATLIAGKEARPGGPAVEVVP